MDIHDAVAHMASALYGIDAGDVFCKFTCDEIEAVTDVLRVEGHEHIADFVIQQHGESDDDPDDQHHNFYDPQHSH